MSAIANSTTKMKKSTLAIPAAALAMPPKPNTAAISAIMKKVNAHPSMSKSSSARIVRTGAIGSKKNNGDGSPAFKYAAGAAAVGRCRIPVGFRCRLYLLAALLGLASAVAWAAPRVNVVALFSDKAMVEIDGRRQLLAIGQSTPEGVRLLAASSTEAMLEIDGQRQTLRLSRQVGGSYAAPAPRQQVQIVRDRNDRFITTGSINGMAMSFLVDTGANVVALNESDAVRAGIDYRRGTRVLVNTAAGSTSGYQVVLARVDIGGISLPNVAAVVLEGGSPSTPLLGMSFLGRLKMRHDGALLVLEQMH